MFANLAKIAKIESLLREDVVKVLRLHRQELNKLEWRFEGKLLEVDKLHIEQNVITERIKERPENLRNDSADSEGLKTQPSVLEITGQATLYELSARTSEREQARWSNVTGKADLRLAIIGAPGSGKSFTTRYTVIKKIDNALKLSRERLCQLSDIEFPLWTTASELVAQNTDQPEKAVNAIIRARFHKFRLSPQFYQWFERKLNFVFEQSSSEDYFSESKILFLVVDSLDELADDQRKDFQNLAKNLDKPSLRLIVTCRTLQWEARSSWLGFIPKEKVEIAPLNFSQQQKLSDGFFQNRSDLRTKMHYLLEGNHALRYALTTPLLLTFGCLLNGENVLAKSTSYVEIYALVIRKVFIGDWRDGEQKPYWANNDVYIDAHLRLLDKICWEIFNRNPELNLFTLDDWKKAYKNAQPDDNEKKISYGEFLTDLEKLGFVVKAFMKNGLRQWSFIHRTFLEFLAARALAGRVNWLEIASQHFWFAPEWLECLTFLSGLLEVENTRKLIAILRMEKDDVFGSMIFLEAKLIGASRFFEEIDYESILKHIKLCFENTFTNISNDDSVMYHEFWFPAMAALRINSTAEKFLFQLLVNPLIEDLRSDDSSVSGWTAELLGKIGDVSDQTISGLIGLLDAENDWFVRTNAIKSLGKLGYASTQVASALIKQLQANDDYSINLSVVTALQELDEMPEIVIKNLIDSLQSKGDYKMRRFAIGLMSELGDTSEKIITHLLQELQSKDDYKVRKTAAKALGKLGVASEPVIENLIERLQSGDHYEVRSSAAEALGRLGISSERIVTILIEILQSDDNYTSLHEAAALALSRLGGSSDLVVNALIDAFQSNDNLTRRIAAKAFGELDNIPERVIIALIDRLRSDDDKMVCYRTAKVLGDICSRKQMNEGYYLFIYNALLQNLSNETNFFDFNSPSDFFDSAYAKPLFQISRAEKRKISYSPL